MLDSNVNLHSAGVAMYFAEVLIVLQEHRAVGLFLFVALSGAVTDVVIVHFDAHFTLLATGIACFWQTKGITFIQQLLKMSLLFPPWKEWCLM